MAPFKICRYCMMPHDPEEGCGCQGKRENEIRKAYTEGEIRKALADAQAAQGTEFLNFAQCPRCGELTMKPSLVTNAYSRHAEIYICDMCGMDEAIRVMRRCPLPLDQWAIASKVHLQEGVPIWNETAN